MNRSVIENLTNQEDNLEKEREIDHWLYFSSEENINIATKKFEELGYKILSNKKLDDEKNYPYQLNISRMEMCIRDRNCSLRTKFISYNFKNCT